MVVYWIHLKNHKIKTDGYVGITSNHKRRWKEHQNTRKTSSIVGNAIKKHTDAIIYDIIFEGSVEACKAIEIYFRPTPEIGWNVIEGGGLPPISYGPKSPEVIAKMVATRKRNGIKMPDTVKQHLSDIRKGTSLSEETKAKQKLKWDQRKNHPDFKHNQTKSANIYDSLNNRIATNVCLKHWCIEHGLNFSGMSKTTKADRTLPASKSNRLYHKGYWAEYV